MELFESFGLEPAFFAAQVINFLILFFVFKKFLYKPILKMLHDREKTISQGLGDAEKAHKTLEEANAQKDEIIKAATVEAEQIIEETKASAQKIREDLLKESQSDADRILTQAKETAQDELTKAQIQIKNISVELSKSVLDRVLRDFFTKEEKEKILKRNMKVFNKYD